MAVDGAPPTRMRAVGPAQMGEKSEKLMKSTAKAVVGMGKILRRHQGALATCLLLPDENQLLRELLDKGKAIQARKEQLKAAKQMAQLRAEEWSWIQLWCTMRMAIAKDVNVPDEKKANITKHVGEVTDVIFVRPHVHVCVVKKCYRQKEWKKDFYKLELMDSPQLQAALEEILGLARLLPEMGGKVGGPARGPHTRAIVDCLVEMGEFQRNE